MKISKDLPIYVLAASILFAGIAISSQAEAAPTTVTLAKYNMDLAKVNQRLKDLEYFNTDLQSKVLRLQNCIVNAPVSGTNATVILRNCSGGY